MGSCRFADLDHGGFGQAPAVIHGQRHGGGSVPAVAGDALVLEPRRIDVGGQPEQEAKRRNATGQAPSISSSTSPASAKRTSWRRRFRLNFARSSWPSTGRTNRAKDLPRPGFRVRATMALAPCPSAWPGRAAAGSSLVRTGSCSKNAWSTPALERWRQSQQQRGDRALPSRPPGVGVAPGLALSRIWKAWLKRAHHGAVVQTAVGAVPWRRSQHPWCAP